MVTKDNTTIYLHIPKTAGSTFHAILGSRYNSAEIKNLFGARFSDPEIRWFIDAPLADKQSIRLLKGHMPFGMHNYLEQPSQYITILRHPINRVVSQYNYIKRNKDNPLHEKVEGGRMSLADFVSSGVAIGMNNGQCRFLNGDIDQYGFNACDDSLLENVKKNIANYFIWVGITERFDESIMLLSKILGWNRRPYYLRENVTRAGKKIDELGKEDEAIIIEFNKLDLILYEFANELMNKEINTIDNYSRELELFKRNNNAIQKYMGWMPSRLVRLFI